MTGSSARREALTRPPRTRVVWNMRSRQPCAEAAWRAHSNTPCLCGANADADADCLCCCLQWGLQRSTAQHFKSYVSQILFWALLRQVLQVRCWVNPSILLRNVRSYLIMARAPKLSTTCVEGHNAVTRAQLIYAGTMCRDCKHYADSEQRQQHALVCLLSLRKNSPGPTFNT